MLTPMDTPADTHAGSGAKRVPLLVFIGAPGVGKSSAARELAHLLEQSQVAVAFVDRDDFGTDGLLHEEPLLGLNEMLHAHVAAGAERLVVAWRVESGLDLARFRTALGWADITVCRLHAEPPALLDRIAAAQASFQRLHLQTMALEIAPRLEVQAAEDILFMTDDLSPRAIALRAMRQWGRHVAPLATSDAALA
jgi:hypothetical protein